MPDNASKENNPDIAAHRLGAIGAKTGNFEHGKPAATTNSALKNYYSSPGCGSRFSLNRRSAASVSAAKMIRNTCSSSTVSSSRKVRIRFFAIGYLSKDWSAENLLFGEIL
ncbi:MAG: hypothetical protein KJO08_10610 [Gammaproteobacteria bacterium]|nr:hypothetical protein [Gammaproteobacteria bacterium]